MKEQVHLRARWCARQATAEQCSVAMLSFLRDLANHDAAFSRTWLKCAKTRADALANRLREVKLSGEFLKELLEKGRFHRKADGSVHEDLGFMSGRLWNGSEDDPAFVFVVCGAYPDPRLMPEANLVWIDLPSSGSAAAELLRPYKLRQLITIVVRAWDPDWARVSTDKMDEEIYGSKEQPYRGQKAGWLTYVSERYGQLPTLPEYCVVVPVEGQGSLIMIKSNEKLTAADPAHVATVREVSAVLEGAGMLAPTPEL